LDEGFISFFSPSVSIHEFAEEFQRILGTYIAGVNSSYVYTRVEQQLSGDEIKAIWNRSDMSWKTYLYSESYGMYRNVLNFYTTHKVLILSVVTALGVVLGAMAGNAVAKKVFYTSESDSDDEDSTQITFDTLDPVEPIETVTKTEKPQSLFRDRSAVSSSRLSRRARKTVKWNIEPQMAMDADPVAFDLATRLNGSCLLMMTFENGDNFVKLGHALVIADRVCVVPKHFYIMLKAKFPNTTTEDGRVIVSFRSTIREKLIHSYILLVDYLKEDKWIFTDKLDKLDQALFILPPDSARRYRDITDRIATLEQHSDNVVRSGFLMGYSDDQNILSTFKFEPVENVACNDPLTGRYSIVNAYAYYANTDKGDWNAALCSC